MRINKSATLAGSLVATVAAGAVAAMIGAGAGPTPAEAATDEPPSTLTLLEDNLAEVTTQQRLERSEGSALLLLPPGATFSAPQSFDSVESQISAIESGRQTKSTEDAELLWFEDGFFTSVMAIDWQCAWLSAGVAGVRSGDAAGVADAVETLHSFTSIEYISSFPDYDAFLTDQVDPLLEGDTSGAESFFPNCSASTIVD